MKNNLNLHLYLQNEWIERNHPKYHHYFKEWVENITENQIYYFTKEMNL